MSVSRSSGASIAVDAGARDRPETRLAGEYRVLEMIAAGAPLGETLDAVCRLVEQVSPEWLASILLVDARADSVWHGAAPTLPGGYVSAIDGARIGPAYGPCGLAALGHEVVAPDIAADARWSAEYRALMLEHGLRACWSTPIKAPNGKALGVLEIHLRQPGDPSGQSGTRLEPFTHLAAIVIARAQAMPADVGGEMLNALRRSEDRYARAMEASGDGHTDWIVATDEFYASPRLLEMCGLPPDTTFAGRSDFVARFPVHPEDRERIVAAVNAHYAGTSARFELDMRVLRRGETRWMHAIFLCSRDASGTLVRASTAVTDVTDRKIAEDELRLRKEELQRLMESVSDYLWSAEVAVDGSYSYRYYSPVVERITGWRPADLLESRERWVALLHPLDRPWVDETFRRLISGATERVDVEYRIVRPDGTLRWVRDSAHGTRAEDGRILLYGVVGDITERKLGAEALRESEARFRALTELSSDWYWEQDENLRFTYLSSPSDDWGGYPGGSSIGKTRWELEGVTPSSGSWAEHEAVLAARRPFRDLEYSRVAPDGTIRYVSVSGAPILDEHGRFKGYQGIGRDITGRREVERSLQQSERRFRQLFENSVDAIFVHDERGRFVDCNAAACRALGYAREELLSLSVADVAVRLLSAARRREMTGKTLWQRAMEGEPGRIVGFEENTLRRKDGTTFPVEVGVGAIEYDGRRLICASVRDTTERKRTEAQLRSRQEMLELAQKAARAVAFEWRVGAPTAGGPRPVSWTVPASVELEGVLGVEPGSFDGSYESWTRLIHPEDSTSVGKSLVAAQQTGDLSLEYRVVHPTGAQRWLQAKGRVLFDAHGDPERVVGFLLDVTEKHKAEEELRRLEKQLRLAQRLEAVGTLAGGIAHDFNNILGAILGYGEMALRGAPPGSRLRRDLDSIMTAGERGRALVDRVLAFSRSGLGERVAVHVEKVVREALDLLEAKLPAGIRVEAALRAGRAAMLGDPTQVHQVLMNLVTNAVQAMPAGGTLRVSLDTVRGEAPRTATIGSVEAGEYVVLTVGDTGTGIARDIIERIFDPFFTTKEVGTGTGLGLSLVHGIVTELGGAIDVASVPGRGSAFTVYLPRSGEAVEPDEGEAAAMPRGDGQRVLIVDDEEPLATLATRTLEELGYAPTGFTSSTAALAAFRADPGRFDAVVTDERMPGMTGTALIRELRDIRREIPILLMSGYVGGAVASRAREAGANEVMKKPLSARELATSLARVLRE
jgi:PAS domain S-box-containing protein